MYIMIDNSWLYDPLDGDSNDNYDNVESIESIEPNDNDDNDVIVPDVLEPNSELEKRLLEKIAKEPKRLKRNFKTYGAIKKGKNKKGVPILVTDKDYETRIYLWLLDGWSEKRIGDELISYGITPGKAIKLIKNVNTSFSAITPAEIEMLKNRYIEMYSDLYKRALEKKDLATARAILDSVVKLQGLITNKVEAKVENTFNIEF